MSKLKRRASASATWTACAGSVAAQEGALDPVTDYQIEGSCAHLLADKAYSEDRPASDFVGHTFTVENKGDQETTYHDWTVDEDMARFVQQYLDVLDDINASATERFSEVNVPIGHITLEEGAEGTADHVGVDVLEGDDGKVTVVVRCHDLKFGRGHKVLAYENTQIALYGLGVVADVAEWYLEGADEVIIEMHIHQPRLHHHDVWKVTLSELTAFGVWMSTRAQATEEMGAPRTASIEGCKWCKARHTCQTRIDALTVNVFEPIPDDLETLQWYLDAARDIKDWVSGLEKYAKELADLGHAIPGYKLVNGRGSRKWKDEDEAAKKLKNRGLKSDQIFTKQLASPAQAENLLGRKRYLQIEEELVEKVPGKPTLAPDDDKRPAIGSGEAMGFADLTQEKEED